MKLPSTSRESDSDRQRSAATSVSPHSITTASAPFFGPNRGRLPLFTALPRIRAPLGRLPSKLVRGPLPLLFPVTQNAIPIAQISR
jgi:hypothetical protein